MEKTIICKRCNKEFIFSEGEAEFYSDRGLNEPKRCPECRDRNKDKRILELEKQVKELKAKALIFEGNNLCVDHKMGG